MEQNFMVNTITEKIIASAIEVHKTMGPGLLESTYEECLAREFDLRSISYERQKEIPIIYKNVPTSTFYRIDLFVEKRIILELKSVEKVDPIHNSQLLTYLRLQNLEVGLLINFNVPVLKDGIKRVVNNFNECCKY